MKVKFTKMEPHEQSPWYLIPRPAGANIPYQKTNSSTGRTRGLLGTGINHSLTITVISLSLLLLGVITGIIINQNRKSKDTRSYSAPSSYNIIGINIAGRQWEVEEAYKIVGQGGWITVMSHPSDFPALLGELKKAPQVNIILRPYTEPLGGGSNREEQMAKNREFARQWAESLVNFDPGGRSIYFMPWNEPNMPEECLGYGSNETTECAEFVSQYIKDLKQFLQEKGLLGSKVKLISPMINQHNPNFYEFLEALGGAVAFYNQFQDSDGKPMIAMNLYDLEDRCPAGTNGRPLCQTDPPQARYNSGRYKELLQNLGVGNAKVFAVETGIVDRVCQSQGGPTDCPFLEDSRMYQLLTAVMPIWKADPDFIMFSPLSYTPGYGGKGDSDPWIYQSLLTKPYLIQERGGGITPIIASPTPIPLPSPTPRLPITFSPPTLIPTLIFPSPTFPPPPTILPPSPPIFPSIIFPSVTAPPPTPTPKPLFDVGKTFSTAQNLWQKFLVTLLHFTQTILP